ncbi:MAG: hypothetical protein M3220_04285 [Chloroflexota bacterium]|nr:hypothetical protein [Chloroflexota bacterium]
MAELIREPIGLRVLLRAIRPVDREPFLLWRADPQVEIDALIEAGQAEDQAALWAALLRWSEAEAAATALAEQGWIVTLHGVRVIALTQAVTILRPPADEQGITLAVGGVTLRAVPEGLGQDEEKLVRMLAFLDEEA